jgi:hypothetical protein
MPVWLVFALLLSLIVALIYQIASRRFGWRVMGYWLAIACGVLAAEAIAETLGLNITRLGDVRLLPDLAGAAVVVAALWFLGI